ncbi:hypothetical protein CEXT_419301 [Caerostris extrusa]|uniref:Uncharacterized protein n=1 Tax=Caerostris extrusa TaxID=172846 RepID=A0AAV4NIW1_CAEEX|nr:hypothetical protein CEXT_419301 [Caerostris extrusa]
MSPHDKQELKGGRKGQSEPQRTPFVTDWESAFAPSLEVSIAFDGNIEYPWMAMLGTSSVFSSGVGHLLWTWGRGRGLWIEGKGVV